MLGEATGSIVVRMHMYSLLCGACTGAHAIPCLPRGCGAFHGHKGLKALLQVMAASACERPLHYATFGDAPLAAALRDCLAAARSRALTVGNLYGLLCAHGGLYHMCAAHGTSADEVALQGAVL